LLFAALLAPAAPLHAVSYFMISDQDLLDRTPVVVRGSAQQSQVVATRGLQTETRTTFSVEEAVRGIAGKSIEVALPGGTLPSGSGSYAWMPEFRNGGDYVLFLYPRPDGVFGMSELELGIFEVQYDSTGVAFAVRPRFPSGAIRALAAAPGAQNERPRELESFLAWIAGGQPETSTPAPEGTLRSPLLIGAGGGMIRPMWDNLSHGSLWRWSNGGSVSVGYVDEDTSDSPGPQAHVSGGGLTEIQNSVSAWNNDSSSGINLSLSAGLKPITIHTDDVSQFGGTGIPCSLGTVGLTSVSFSGTHSFKSETYRSVSGADVYLRRWDCTTSNYLGTAFENVTTHELGHTLGLGHPDDGTSPHDNTPNDVSGAVMISVGNYNRPTGLGSDDVEGICYLYGNCTGAVVTPPPPPPPPPPPSGSGPVASFSYSPSSPGAGTTVSFFDVSSGSPTSWAWNFGDAGSGTSSISMNPTHLYASAGTYVVHLSAANAFGSSTTFRSIVIASSGTAGCTADMNTLCLQTGRFQVRVAWQALHLGTSGKGIAMPLTTDTGAFWFFNSSNIELVVKVLDGRAINGHFWVFYGALSDAQYTLIVTDKQTGAVRTYTNPQDTMASVADTAAF
jgi:PKD repeat protein